MKALIFLLSFLLAIPSAAQINDQHLSTIFKVPASMLIGEIYSRSIGIGVEVEKQKTAQKSISFGIGYFFKNPKVPKSYVFRQQVDQLNGIRLNTEIRKYLGKKAIIKSGLFVALDWDHILTFSKEDIWLNAIRSRENIIRYRTTSHVNIGIQSFTKSIKGQSRISFEIITGLGLGYIKANSNIEKQVFTKGISSNINYYNGAGFYPAINLDAKLGFAF